MAEEPPRAAPPVIVQRGGGGLLAIAGDAFDSLKATPTLLLIILLNAAFAGSAAWFMTNLENTRAEAMRMLLDRCLPIHAPQYPPTQREERQP